MQYLGGKHRIAKPLAAYLESRRDGMYFVEPFCGALNVSAQMRGPRLACDASPYLFTLYNAMRAGWVPPEELSEEEYTRIKAAKDPGDPLTAFAGYGCSFAGKFFGGYARGVGQYARAAARGLLRKMAACAEATFGQCSYERLNVTGGCLVYCDPPYAATTGYAAVGAFDNAAFWRHCKEWASTGATVLVSEYAAPEGTKCVWSIQTKTDMHGAGKAGRTEKLFEVEP